MNQTTPVSEVNITGADIEKLAALSRMKIAPEEKESFAAEIKSILGYIDQIKEVGGDIEGAQDASKISHKNVLREDVASAELCPDPTELVKLTPDSQDGYVKVKQILG